MFGKQRVKDQICPLLGKPCIGTDCKFYVQLRGKNPQTGQEVDSWDCSVAFLPMLMIENSQQQRQTGAAVESFRNEMVRQQDAMIEAVSNSVDNLSAPTRLRRISHD